jgi:hypothetical protein
MPPHFAVMPVNRQLSAPATGFEQPTSVILVSLNEQQFS